MFKVRACNLLIVAGAVWLAAGVNIVRLGILGCLAGTAPILALLIGIPAIFLIFHIMFSKLVGKHANRIRSYGDNRLLVLRFFDAKGYLIMAFMMSAGIGLRAFGVVPDWFVAFFYTGLGTALMLAGVGFLVHFHYRGGQIVCPVTKRTRLA